MIFIRCIVSKNGDKFISNIELVLGILHLIESKLQIHIRNQIVIVFHKSSSVNWVFWAFIWQFVDEKRNVAHIIENDTKLTELTISSKPFDFCPIFVRRIYYLSFDYSIWSRLLWSLRLWFSFLNTQLQ